MNPRTPPDPATAPGSDAIAVACAAMYFADLRDAYAFTFRVPATNTRFTTYTSRADRYAVGETYALLLAAPDAVPLPMTVEDIEFLRTCLDSAAQRWREAIAEADLGAERPPQSIGQEVGCINVEPTRGGYRAAGQLFRDQLDRVEQINARLRAHLHSATADGGS